MFGTGSLPSSAVAGLIGDVIGTRRPIASVLCVCVCVCVCLFVVVGVVVVVVAVGFRC